MGVPQLVDLFKVKGSSENRGNVNRKLNIVRIMQFELFQCQWTQKIYRVFARRVNTFVTSYFQFFYNIYIDINEFTYSKFCENSEYAHFKRVK